VVAIASRPSISTWLEPCAAPKLDPMMSRRPLRGSVVSDREVIWGAAAPA
jgi:hypothetical protein